MTQLMLIGSQCLLIPLNGSCCSSMALVLPEESVLGGGARRLLAVQPFGLQDPTRIYLVSHVYST